MPRTRAQASKNKEAPVGEVDVEDNDEKLPLMLSNERIYYITNAPTGNAKCRKCKLLVAQNALRFGMSSEQKMGFACDDIDPRGNGDGGYFRQVKLIRWYHFHCFRITKLMQNEMKTPEAFEGFSKLTREDKDKVAELFNAGGFATPPPQPKKKLSRELAALKAILVRFNHQIVAVLLVLLVVGIAVMRVVFGNKKHTVLSSPDVQ